MQPVCVCVCVLHLSSSSLQLWNGLQSHLGSTLIVKRLPPLSKFKQLNTACYSVFIGAFQTHIMFRIYTKSWRLLPWACQNLSSWREDSTRSILEHLNAPCVGIIVPLITKVLHHKTHLCLTANNNFYWHKSYKISIRPMLCKQAYESKKTSNHQSHNIISKSMVLLHLQKWQWLDNFSGKYIQLHIYALGCACN